MPPDITKAYTCVGPLYVNRWQKHGWTGWKGRGRFVDSYKVMENRKKMVNEHE
jgi:hypothetical protein